MLILMAGLPGSGKSTLSRALAAKFDATVLDKDEIRAALFAPADIEYSTEQDDFCMGIMLKVAGYIFRKEPSRRIFLDGRMPPDDLFPTYNGFSTGTWDGNWSGVVPQNIALTNSLIHDEAASRYPKGKRASSRAPADTWGTFPTCPRSAHERCAALGPGRALGAGLLTPPKRPTAGLPAAQSPAVRRWRQLQETCGRS